MKKVVGSSIVVSLLFWLAHAEQTSTKKEPEMQLPVESVATPSLTPDMEAAEALKKLEAAKKDEELKVKSPLVAQPDEDEEEPDEDEEEDEDDYDFEEDEDDGDWDEDDIDDDND